MRNSITLMLLSAISIVAHAQNKQNASLAQKAFNAWSLGEASGNYFDFKAFITQDFEEFSHPLIGNFKGEQARINLEKLIEEREIKSNNLKFTDIELINNKQQFVFLFNSSGTVAGGFPYQGFNAIVLTIQNKTLVGFQEYFGFVDPSWFK